MRTGLLLLALVGAEACAQASTKVVCSYAPSQSDVVASISGVAGTAATGAAVAAATGLTAVTHSSGALILTGASGYVGGTLGATAAATAAAPAIVVVGLVVGGVAVTVELVCVGQNHPEQVTKVHEAAKEFARRFDESLRRTKTSAEGLKSAVAPAVGRAAVRAERVASDVWKYAYQKSVAVARSLQK